MSSDLSILNVAIRLPLTGVTGAPIRNYGPTSFSDMLWSKVNCEFDSSRSKFGGGSISFTGYNSYLRSIEPGGVRAEFGVDFTLECFVRTNTVSRGYQGILTESSSHGLFISNNTIIYYNGGTQMVSPPIVSDQWYHIALTRLSGGIVMFVDGVKCGTTFTNPNTYPQVYIGSSSNPSESLDGNMNGVRFLVGVALYTANFTPPTTPMDLSLFSAAARAISTFLKLVSVDIPPQTYRSMPLIPSLFDSVHGGKGHIAGTVKQADVSSDKPVIRKVRLHRKIDGMLIRETWSSADGSYHFAGIAVQPYYVTSFDHTGNLNAVIKDSITPEVI